MNARGRVRQQPFAEIKGESRFEKSSHRVPDGLPGWMAKTFQESTFSAAHKAGISVNDAEIAKAIQNTQWVRKGCITTMPRRRLSPSR